MNENESELARMESEVEHAMKLEKGSLGEAARFDALADRWSDSVMKKKSGVKRMQMERYRQRQRQRQM